nr:alpha/beta hydrolase [Rhodospirillales bacterium]
MTNETKLIKVNGISLEAKWVNARSHQNDRVMVFLHEGLGCVSMWQDFPQMLSNRTGLSSFVYSRQGYGNSDPVPLPRNLDFMHAEGLDVLPNILDVE